MHTADAVFLIDSMSLGSKEIAEFWGGSYREKIDVTQRHQERDDAGVAVSGAGGTRGGDRSRWCCIRSSRRNTPILPPE